jgi:tripartite-type tricarboxylate transporter receptor subunit TctC
LRDNSDGSATVTILRRRDFILALGGAAVLAATPHLACAQDYPSRPVRVVVCFPAGTATDIIARLMVGQLSERLGQQFVIDDRAGAAGNLGTEFVVRAPPDGYTLLLVDAPNAINATLYDDLNFNFIRDIAPVAGIGRVPFVMTINPSLPAKTVAEFIAYAKANPDNINMVTGGSGTATDVFGELFKMMTGVTYVNVPYRSDYMADLLGGQVQGVFGPIPSSIGYIRAGKLRALAVTTARRSPALPDVPALGEFVPGYEASGWYGLGAPKDTPNEIIDKLNREANAGLADPTMRARLADVGAEPMIMTAAEFKTFIANETDKWSKVIKFAGIKPD